LSNYRQKNDEKNGVIALKSKRNPESVSKFRLLKEELEMKFLKRKRTAKDGEKKRILDFDMSKLEMEYDYDTD